MRFSIVLPDEMKTTIRDRAAEAGISQTEWARRLVLAGCTSDAPPRTSDTPPRTSDTPPSAHLDAPPIDARITALEAERDQARQDLAAERVRVAVLEAVTTEKDERIRDLQTTIGSITAGLRPALPEPVGETPPPRRIRDRIADWLNR